MTEKPRRNPSKRALALMNRDVIFQGARCSIDGTTLKNTDTGHCVECARYRRAILAGRIDGIDKRAETEKMGALKPVKSSWNDEAFWTDEMRKQHAELIRRGRARSRAARLTQQEGSPV